MLEKILEEIEEATFQEDAPIYVGNMEIDEYVRASAGRTETLWMNYDIEEKQMSLDI